LTTKNDSGILFNATDKRSQKYAKK